MKCCTAVQHFTYNTFVFLYFFIYNKVYYFCFGDLMFFTQYTTINNNNIIYNNVVYIRILDYLFIYDNSRTNNCLIV